MQEVHNQQLEVGNLVRINWPRSRWDNRQGRLHELREEPGQKSHAFVLLDGIAVAIHIEKLKICKAGQERAMTKGAD